MGRIFLHGDNRLCPALSWQGMYKALSITALLYQTLYFGLNETKNSNQIVFAITGCESSSGQLWWHTKHVWRLRLFIHVPSQPAVIRYFILLITRY